MLGEEGEVPMGAKCGLIAHILRRGKVGMLCLYVLIL